MTSRFLLVAALYAVDGLVQQEPAGIDTFLLHIPKTAGVSARHDLPKLHLRKGQVFCDDEICYGGAPRSAQFITFLREPLAHLLSQYQMCLRYRDVPKQTFFQNKVPDTFAKWLQHWSSAAPEATEDSPSALGCYHPVNLQSRILSCRSNQFCPALDRYVLSRSDTHPAVAPLNRLDEFTYVGVTELYQESMCVIHIKERGEFPPFCNCQDTAAWSLFPQMHESHGARRQQFYSISSNEAMLASNLTRNDKLLYEKAVQRLGAEIAELERRYEKKIWCKDALQSALVQSSKYQVELLPFDDMRDTAGVGQQQARGSGHQHCTISR